MAQMDPVRVGQPLIGQAYFVASNPPHGKISVRKPEFAN